MLNLSRSWTTQNSIQSSTEVEQQVYKSYSCILENIDYHDSISEFIPSAPVANKI